MNDYIRVNLESGQRCRQFFIDFVSIIPPGSIFETKANGMTAEVDLLETTAGEQEAAESEGLAATDVKGSERSDLTAEMDPVRTAARAAEFDVPGTRDRYRYNLAMSHQNLLAAGRSFAQGGATDEAFLVGYDAPAGWPAAITAACDAYEATFRPARLRKRPVRRQKRRALRHRGRDERLQRRPPPPRQKQRRQQTGRPSRLEHRRPRRETMKKKTKP